MPPPGRPQDTTTMARSGASEDEPPPPEAPRPAAGPRPARRAARQPVLLRLGVSGEGGLPLRRGVRDGHRRERVATLRASEASRAGGWEGVRGLVADRQASRRRPLGVGLAQGLGGVPCVPRPWTGRQALAAWGQPHAPGPLVVEQPGCPTAEAPRRWPGPSVCRPREGADHEGRGAPQARRWSVMPSSPLAPPPGPSEAAAQAPAAGAGADHGRPGPAPWGAGRPEAEAAIAEAAGRGPGRRGRRPRPWR
jgi:hypothetical protein